METKTLHAIQVLSKIGKIFSKIVMICCIVGFGLCIAGLLGVAAGGEILKLGGVTIKGIIGNTAGFSEGTLYAATAAGLVLCGGEAVLAGFAAHRELADGTPFAFAGARERLRLGILAICIPIGTEIVAAIIRAVISGFFTNVTELSLDPVSSVSIGVMFILMSLLCRHGAELSGTERA